MPATTVNNLLAGWLQFMVHDWLSHGVNDHASPPHRFPVPPGDDWPRPDMTILRTCPDDRTGPKDEGRPATFRNVVTHWWDGSQIYGSDLKMQTGVRSCPAGLLANGKLHMDETGHLPIDPEADADDPERELCPLTRGLVGVAGDDRLANDHQPAAFLDRQRERTVEQCLIAHQDAQRVAQRRLVADQQSYRPEVGQQARLGHAQTEAFVARQGCGRVQQSSDTLPWDHEVRLAQDTGAQARVKEHPHRIQSGSQGDLAVVGEGRSAD